ncbi:MAG: hypothetical protein Phyf2KO_12280 [Phycisphaerales bacterium]
MGLFSLQSDKLAFWSEPAVFAKQYRRYRIVPWGFHVVAAFLAIFICSIPIWVEMQDDSPWWYFLIFAVLAGGAVYAVAWLDSNGGAMITLNKKGVDIADSMLFTQIPILFLFRYRMRTYKWQAVGSVEYRYEECGGKGCDVFEIRNSTGEVIDTLGAKSGGVKIDKVAGIVERNGSVFLRHETMVSQLPD